MTYVLCSVRFCSIPSLLSFLHYPLFCTSSLPGSTVLIVHLEELFFVDTVFLVIFAAFAFVRRVLWFGNMGPVSGMIVS